MKLWMALSDAGCCFFYSEDALPTENCSFSSQNCRLGWKLCCRLLVYPPAPQTRQQNFNTARTDLAMCRLTIVNMLLNWNVGLVCSWCDSVSGDSALEITFERQDVRKEQRCSDITLAQPDQTTYSRHRSFNTDRIKLRSSGLLSWVKSRAAI